MSTDVVRHSFLDAQDLHLFAEGTHLRLWEKLGAHVAEIDGSRGVRFAVWAPNAKAVSVIGEFNGWRPGAHPLVGSETGGVWEGFLPGLETGVHYKYAIESNLQGYRVDKTDPVGFAAQIRPDTASRVWNLDGYEWRDGDWMSRRGSAHRLDAPIAAYEVHLGSWMRGENNRWLTYRELAPKLADYVRDLGYTHIEFLPWTEHPFDGSWGYQTVGYYAPTSRFGTPHDLMFLIDTLHQAGIGVILDWVPGHFPRDTHGLGFFDGTHLYEHADPRLGRHPDWDTYIFNFGRPQVRSFLLSNALFWLERYHVDGLRIDAVASMIYLDYSRKEGEWIPNAHGGRENLDAVSFLRAVNEQVYAHHPDTFTVAEESTSWPMVSRPLYLGGLGFGYKWDMGWMHDTLQYLSLDPIHRRFHHQRLTFRMMYAYTENFLLPLSHDEVVHGKSSLVGKMPGDDWRKFANLRLLLAMQTAQPGKKLLFMGGEFAQWREWNHDRALDWHLLEFERHQGVQRLVRDLNSLYRREPALHELDCDPQGFQWIDCSDTDQSVVAFLRRNGDRDAALLCVFNGTPLPRYGYRLGVPWSGRWEEVLNTDAPVYGGSGVGNLGSVTSESLASHGKKHSVVLTLPPLGLVMLRSTKPAGESDDEVVEEPEKTEP
jgi:1,4-alpha-glucan branching enzyme